MIYLKKTFLKNQVNIKYKNSFVFSFLNDNNCTSYKVLKNGSTKKKNI